MTESASPTSAGVNFPPPFLYVLGLVLAWVLETRVRRLHIVGDGASPESLQLVGLIALALGLGLVMWGMITFATAGTAIIPNRPAKSIVETGPYRFTRNPMYVGLTSAYFGGALITNSVWAILILPLVLYALYHNVILREEAYLGSAFPEEYAAYRKHVRRWL
jgi:protein-S-isoprenylcysteine O-methyltransferase Ste14